MTTLVTVLALLAGTVITAFVAYLIARHERSGDVKGSKAEDLWTTVRGELQRVSAEAVELRKALAESVAALAESTIALAESTAAVAGLKQELVYTHEQMAWLREQLAERMQR